LLAVVWDSVLISMSRFVSCWKFQGDPPNFPTALFILFIMVSTCRKYHLVFVGTGCCSYQSPQSRSCTGAQIGNGSTTVTSSDLITPALVVVVLSVAVNLLMSPRAKMLSTSFRNL
jgi:hypothetical protein